MRLILRKSVTAGKQRVNETRVALESERRACLLRLTLILALLLSQATKQGISRQVGGLAALCLQRANHESKKCEFALGQTYIIKPMDCLVNVHRSTVNCQASSL